MPLLVVLSKVWFTSVNVSVKFKVKMSKCIRITNAVSVPVCFYVHTSRPCNGGN